MLHVNINEKSKTRESTPCIGCMFPPSHTCGVHLHMRGRKHTSNAWCGARCVGVEPGIFVWRGQVAALIYLSRQPPHTYTHTHTHTHTHLFLLLYTHTHTYIYTLFYLISYIYIYIYTHPAKKKKIELSIFNQNYV